MIQRVGSVGPVVVAGRAGKLQVDQFVAAAISTFDDVVYRRVVIGDGLLLVYGGVGPLFAEYQIVEELHELFAANPAIPAVAHHQLCPYAFFALTVEATVVGHDTRM